MDIVAHRVNDVAALKKLNLSLGAEIDIRSKGSHLILSHDPFLAGPRLEDFLDMYAETRRECLLILNPKEDGHEKAVLTMLGARQIERFFFLDLTLPTLVRLARRENERRLAVRFSEFEPFESVEAVGALAEWVWADCFDGAPPSPSSVTKLKYRHKVCLVSPELQGYAPDAVDRFLPLKASIDAVCTKYPDRWR